MQFYLKALLSSSIIFSSIFFDYGCLAQSSDTDELFSPSNQKSRISSDKASFTSRIKDWEQPMKAVKKVGVKANKPQLRLHLYDCDGDEIKKEFLIPYNNYDDQCNSIFARTESVNTGKGSFISAEYQWQAKNPDLVVISDSIYSGDSSGKSFDVLRDMITDSVLDKEPSTTIQICAYPKLKDFEPICRQIILRSIVNFEGTWCFQGASFVPDLNADCQALKIEQQGRRLFLEDGSQGEINEKQVDFFFNDYEYRAFLDDHAEISTGQVIVGNDLEGYFSAFRLPD